MATCRSQNPRNLQAHGSGFTLIELLVVIGIIAILAAMLLPVLVSAKNHAQGTVDLNNNHQIMMALNLYSDENSTLLPDCGWGTTYAAWCTGPNFPTGGATDLTTLDKQIQLQLASYRIGGQLYPYLKSDKVLMCPADKPNALFFQRNVYISSYVWNGAIVAYNNPPKGINPQTYKITYFKPLTIIQWETDEQTPHFFNDVSSYPDEGISGRHGNGATLGVLSGSTVRVDIRRWYDNTYAGTKGARGASIPDNMLPNDLWCNPGRGNGLPAP